jgi:RimJ/RimL family protein N-acetyltransferase
MPSAETLASERLLLTPLQPDDADEMADVLADERLYAHTGGSAPDRATLSALYTRQSAGSSPDGSELWFNWIARDRGSRAALGYVQVTLHLASGTADVAWVIGAEHQRRGYATEAAAAVLTWLAACADVRRVTAHIAEANRASQGVARRLGLFATGEVEDGEEVWSTEP